MNKIAIKNALKDIRLHRKEHKMPWPLALRHYDIDCMEQLRVGIKARKMNGVYLFLAGTELYVGFCSKALIRTRFKKSDKLIFI